MELLEGVSARIDTPHFDEFHMIFFMDPIFDIPQFHRFISCTRSLGPLNPAQLQLSGDAVRIFFGSSSALFWQEIKCRARSAAFICDRCMNKHFPLLSQVK